MSESYPAPKWWSPCHCYHSIAALAENPPLLRTAIVFARAAQLAC